MDPYSLLGISPGADQGELKRAFRRLAMRWHPDRNPAPEAGEHFKSLRAAYDTLLAELDGSAAQEDAAADEDIATEPAEAPASRGADRRQSLTISLETACLGGEVQVEVEDEAVCLHCHGSGEIALAHTRLCATCHGSGKLRSARGLVGCAVCGGRGYVSRDACPHCEGSGRARDVRRLAVKLPPGLIDGDEVRLEGEGEPCPEAGGRPGDLRLVIEIAPHPLFRRAGRDLHLTRPLSVFRLLAGGEIAVPVPGGVRRVSLSGNAQDRCLRVEGAGLPARGGRPAGALVVELEPLQPDRVDAAARPLLERLDAAVRDRLPAVAEWEDRWLADD